MSGEYRDDPRWLAARDRYVAEPGEGETSQAVMVRCITAALNMYEIETEAVPLPE